MAPYQPTKTNYVYGTNAEDPYYFTDISAHAPCCQSFVITLTDGALTRDDKIHPNVRNMAPPAYGGTSSQPMA